MTPASHRDAFPPMRARRITAFIVAAATAGILEELIDHALPADLTRDWVIAWSGAAAIFWSAFICFPLQCWSERSEMWRRP